ncbi:MAG TPA: glycosyltransferase [Steroidobacteraceae bacterium]|nr:glycosyltransferase [Steroidobacteraceae bacterium]
MSGLRIVHAILSKGFAGSERATAEMCNAHCAEHAVLLILKRGHMSRHGVSIRQWLDPRVEVVEVGNWLPRAGMERALAEFRPDVIHAHLRRSTRLLARIRPRAATIATLHLTVNGPNFQDMDGLICIAKWQHDDIPASYRGRVFDINESLIPNRRLDAAQIAALRRELGASPADYLVGGVGRLARSKGFDLLIEAFRRAQLPAARLVIVGEGRERRRLARQLGAGMSLPGFRTDAKDCYQAFDVFVSPSRSEPLGRVVLEALDAGVPVVASATRGPAEILTRYPGDLFPIGDVDALAALLRRYHERRPPRMHHDLSAYHLPVIARETEAAYRELIAAKQALHAVAS